MHEASAFLNPVFCWFVPRTSCGLMVDCDKRRRRRRYCRRGRGDTGCYVALSHLFAYSFYSLTLVAGWAHRGSRI
jgi:hypothetical protein